jgi:hypothetical protein
MCSIAERLFRGCKGLYYWPPQEMLRKCLHPYPDRVTICPGKSQRMRMLSIGCKDLDFGGSSIIMVIKQDTISQ